MLEKRTRVLEILVDCRGIKLPEGTVSCNVDGQRWTFILADHLNHGLRCNIALFANAHVMSDLALSYPRTHRACVLSESPIFKYFTNIDDLACRYPLIMSHQQGHHNYGEPFVPLMLGTNWLGARSDTDMMEILELRPSKSKLISFVGSLDHANCGAYKFRREIAEYCLAKPDVDCFGKQIQEVSSKREAITPYYFSIAMESAASNFYFSEKLIDCLLLEAIPVYYGCPGIGDIFDIRGMLTFNNLAEFAEILTRLTPALYERMRPFVVSNKERAISEGWHNNEGLFTRMARQMVGRYALDRMVSPNPLVPLKCRVKRAIHRIFT